MKQHPIGTGPFKFVSWKRLHTTVMARHDTYWEKDADGNPLPYLDEIIGKPLTDDTVRLTALRTGEVDMIDAASYRDQARFSEWKDAFDTYLIKALGTIWYYFNAQRPPFDDVRVRRAVAMAVDKKEIMRKTLFGHGEVMDQFYTEASPWRLPGMAAGEYNPDEARRLLKEAGVRRGTPAHADHLQPVQLHQGRGAGFSAADAPDRFHGEPGDHGLGSTDGGPQEP